MRDAKVFQIVEGTSEIQRQIVTTYLRSGADKTPG
jgi:alkylation response protein AidB-like acyl-CoA dehydrogenase